MATTVRCKFVCQSVTTYQGWAKAADGKKALLYNAKFMAVTDGSPEDKKFWDATPAGTFEVSTIKEMPWEIGKDYYFDISPAE